MSDQVPAPSFTATKADHQRLNDEYMRGYRAASSMLDALIATEREAARAEGRREAVPLLLDKAIVAIHLSEHSDIDYESCPICPDFRAAVEHLRVAGLNASESSPTSPCCGHLPHGNGSCHGMVTDWGGERFPCPCDGRVGDAIESGQ